MTLRRADCAPPGAKPGASGGKSQLGAALTPTVELLPQRTRNASARLFASGLRFRLVAALRTSVAAPAIGLA